MHDMVGCNNAASPAGIGQQAMAAREILSFRLGREKYGIDILKVQEIRGYQAPTVLVDAPPYIKGVIDLRGVIVPIADLRIRFQLADPRYDEFTVIVILNLSMGAIGVVVDAVEDVVPLRTESVRPAPEFASSGFDAGFVAGLATLEDELLILLDIEKLVGAADFDIGRTAVQ